MACIKWKIPVFTYLCLFRNVYPFHNIVVSIKPVSKWNFFPILARMTFEIFLSCKCFMTRLSPKDVVSLALFCLICHQLLPLADWGVSLFLKRGLFRYLLVYFTIPSDTHDIFKAFRISLFPRYHGASYRGFYSECFHLGYVAFCWRAP